MSSFCYALNPCTPSKFASNIEVAHSPCMIFSLLVAPTSPLVYLRYYQGFLVRWQFISGVVRGDWFPTASILKLVQAWASGIAYTFATSFPVLEPLGPECDCQKPLKCCHPQPQRYLVRYSHLLWFMCHRQLVYEVETPESETMLLSQRWAFFVLVLRHEYVADFVLTLVTLSWI